MAYVTSFSFTEMSIATRNSTILNIYEIYMDVSSWLIIPVTSPIYHAILFNIDRPRFMYIEWNLCGVVKIIRHARPFSSIARYFRELLSDASESIVSSRKSSEYCKYFTPMVERGSPYAPRHVDLELCVRNNERYLRRLHFTFTLVCIQG